MPQSCRKCLYSDRHPFGISLVNDTCSGCITHEEKYTLDWAVRYAELQELVASYSKKEKSYDCVVPVIGDAEDFFTLEQVLSLGLSPLVVSVNDYFKTDIGWKNLHQLITHFDVDSLVYHPDLNVYKELIKTSLRKFNHMLLPFLQLHTSFPVHIAVERNIPLVIWGQQQSIEQVGKFSHQDAVQMTKWSRKTHDLFNIDLAKLIGNGAQVDIRTLNYYDYPKIDKLFKSNVRGIYLSNYMPWDPLKQNTAMLKYGYIPQQSNSSFDTYERAGSSVYYGIHDLLKYKRTGYRKVTDHISREIRHNRITTEEGKALIGFYQNKVDIKPFFDWLGVTKSGYEWFVKHRLSDVQSMIGKCEGWETPVLPKGLQPFYNHGRAPQNSFVLFGKGLHI